MDTIKQTRQNKNSSVVQ